jgi:hypothetical protein
MMEKKYLKQYFISDDVPPWNCPTCSGGRLMLKGQFSMNDDAVTQRDCREEWFDSEHSHYVFNGLLQCNSCSEHVVVSGDGTTEEDYGVYERNYYNVLTPKFFYPPLKIIEPNTNNKVPENVKIYLEKAFQVFWCDAGSCVNRLRTVLEYMLDDLQVDRLSLKGERLDLGSRIVKIVDPKFAHVKDAMTSLRHMGNDGSHGAIDIQRHELLSAFSVIKYCLEQIYAHDHSDVLKFVSQVNERKGFRSK